MTEKQENILASALELFAREGYKATSTSKVAKHAGVSEGLIFRHFDSKEGLLEAIMKQGETKARNLFAEVVMETDPKEVIRKTLEIGLKIKENPKDEEFWKLQYKIKWEMEDYAGQKMEPVELALSNAFRKLGYNSPEQEAKFLLINMDGMAMRLFLDKSFDLEGQIALIRLKYQV